MPRRTFMQEVMLRSVVSRLSYLFHNSDRVHFQALSEDEQKLFSDIKRPYVNDLEIAIDSLDPCAWKTILSQKLQTYKIDFNV
jgi:hypothetical protein